MNAIVLLIVGLWGYIANDYALHTLIVPLAAAILFGLMGMFFLIIPGRATIILMMILSLGLFVAFIVPFRRNAEQADYMGMLRLGLEMLACAIAFIVYLRSLKTFQKA
jgi:hydrogenase/urease accessory protein HupE